MSSREKLLAIVVGSLLLFFAAYGVYNSVTSGIRMRKVKIASLKKQVVAEEQRKAASLRDAQLVQQFKVRSLDSKVPTANLAFYRWLNDQLEAVGLEDKGNVDYKGLGRNTDDYKELKYTLVADGDLEQITELVHGIQSADTLHRVETLGIRQKGDGETLGLEMNIAALSMGDAGKPKTEVGQIAEGKLPKTLDEYRELIAYRNMFAPANNPPKFSRFDREKVELDGDPFEFTFKAKDPDGHKLTYTLISGDAIDEDDQRTSLPTDSAELDGRDFSWTPEELGNYEFKVEVKDNGLPPKTDVATLQVRVVEKRVRKPPPEEPEEEGLDEATLAYLTGFVKGPKDPEPAIWMDLRSKGESMTLFAGDEFEIGKWKGVVKELRPFENTILLEDEDGEVYEMRIGQKLSDREPIEL